MSAPGPRAAHVSASARYRARILAFVALAARSCSCPLELREERDGTLRCATCDRPFVAKVAP